MGADIFLISSCERGLRDMQSVMYTSPHPQRTAHQGHYARYKQRRAAIQSDCQTACSVENTQWQWQGGTWNQPHPRPNHDLPEPADPCTFVSLPFCRAMEGKEGLAPDMTGWGKVGWGEGAPWGLC